MAVVLKSKKRWLKKRMEKGDGRFCSCSKTHWEQLIQTLKQKDNVERATQL
jgi:hypothetical protein